MQLYYIGEMNYYISWYLLLSISFYIYLCTGMIKKYMSLYFPTDIIL